jgi:hypothetical protein
MMFSKFRHGEWRTWPKTEQKAVEDFLHALWSEILNNPPSHDSYTDVESWLCSIAQSEDDLQPYLVQWVEDESQNACLALSSLLLSSAVVLPGSRGRNAFWDGRDAQYAQLQRWAKSPTVEQKLRRARDEWADTEIAEEFDRAISIVA